MLTGVSVAKQRVPPASSTYNSAILPPQPKRLARGWRQESRAGAQLVCEAHVPVREEEQRVGVRDVDLAERAVLVCADEHADVQVAAVLVRDTQVDRLEVGRPAGTAVDPAAREHRADQRLVRPAVKERVRVADSRRRLVERGLLVEEEMALKHQAQGQVAAGLGDTAATAQLLHEVP